MPTLADLARSGISGLYGSVGGWPVDTGVSLANLLRAGYGYGGSKLGYLGPTELPSLIDSADVPGSTASIGRLLNVGDSTQEQIAQIIGGMLGPGGNKAPSKLDATVYHGSPHTFDKFDTSKIGTGEGAQAYGHGLYFADRPEVAKSYARGLFSVGQTPTLEERAAKLLDNNVAPDSVAKALQRVDSSLSPDTAQDYVSKGRQLLQGKSGNVYKVDIPDDSIANMLHWDKPLSEQSPQVQQKLQSIVGDISHPSNATMTGGDLVQALGLSDRFADNAAAQLRAAGIPGIRYLDAGSRESGGTYNTVLSDDKLAQILSRQ